MSEGEVRIVVNGQPRTVRRGETIAGLLDSLELDGRLVVVELNRQIVRRTERAEIAVEEGDAIELVHFVGGG